MKLKIFIIFLLVTLYFTLVDFYKLGKLHKPVYVNKSTIIFEATEYDTTKEIWKVDLQ